jgi:hypothetical protein
VRFLLRALKPIVLEITKGICLYVVAEIDAATCPGNNRQITVVRFLLRAQKPIKYDYLKCYECSMRRRKRFLNEKHSKRCTKVQGICLLKNIIDYCFRRGAQKEMLLNL